jgi:hypothetical protein
MAKEILFVQEDGNENYSYTIRINGSYCGKMWCDGQAIIRPMEGFEKPVFDNVNVRTPKVGTMKHLFEALQKM